MAHIRFPGPLCVSDQNFGLRDGTLALFLSPLEGPVCAATGGYPLLRPRFDPTPLFRQCLNPKRGLTAEDFASAADTLEVDIASIQAVAEVETAGDAFDGLGRPRILYERHYFHRLTLGEFDKNYPLISSRSAGGYGKFSSQYSKLEQAYKLDPDAALQSASWGRFQIMGTHYAKCGFVSPQAFVEAMMKAESEHLNCFVAFLKDDKEMLKALQGKNWKDFARRYNGPGYSANQYDTKMETAYQRFSKATAPVQVPSPSTGPAPSRLP